MCRHFFFGPQDANLDMVDQLLQNMLKDDTEHDKLIHLPFLRDLLDDYQAKQKRTAAGRPCLPTSVGLWPPASGL